jgi:hypothetical protein
LKTVADSRFDMDSLNTNTKTKAIAAFHDFYTPTTPSSPLPNMNSKEKVVDYLWSKDIFNN